MNKNKKGIIVISKEIYEHCWGAAGDIFKVFKPSHIEFRHWENDVWYFYGTCEFFEEVKEGFEIPKYDVMFNTVDNTYSFKKC